MGIVKCDPGVGQVHRGRNTLALDHLPNPAKAPFCALNFRGGTRGLCGGEAAVLQADSTSDQVPDQKPPGSPTLQALTGGPPPHPQPSESLDYSAKTLR